MMNNQKTLLVIGGGAAGFFCAINAAAMNPSLKIIIIEKTSKVLSKVKISGGGRCNVTNDCFDIEELAKKYPRGQQFLRKAFHQFNPKHTIQWFKERNIILKAEPDGRMFPSTNSSQTIIDCFLSEINKHAIELRVNCEVIEIQQYETEFSIITSNATTITAHFLCIATGGYPKSIQFDWLKKIGHTIDEPIPSLFSFNIPNAGITQLMGISVNNVAVKIAGTKLQQQGAILLTHWGLSGPVILKLSAFAAKELNEKKYQFVIVVNWLGNKNENSLHEEWHTLRINSATKKMGYANPFQLPNRLWQYLLQQSFIDENIRWAELTSKQQYLLIKNLTAQELKVNGKTTFKEEFVTCGGIVVNEIDVNTMQSKKMKHLFFAGEVLNIDGITGGFNFQNAWTTAWIAAKNISEISMQ